MRKVVFFVIVIFLGLFVFTEGLLDALFAFLLAGAIPGTSHSLSPSFMMALLTATALFSVTRLTPKSLLLSLSTASPILRLSRHRLPRRRYTPVQSIES